MISIIVPIYKTEKYIQKCISSIANQTNKHIEIILVDDGSPDSCPEICNEWAEKDKRVKVIHKKNGGLVSARKAGLEIANGDYIGFVDGDDFIEPDMFEKMQDMISEYSPDMVLCDFYYDFGDKAEESRQLFTRKFYNKNALISELYPKMLFSGEYYKFGINPCCWSKVYKRELLEKNLALVDNKIKMGEDAAFTYPCLLDAETVCTISEPLYHYMIHENSMTQSYDENLKNIILLPYNRINEKNAESSFDISAQLNYYLLYLVNFLIRNEIAGGNVKEIIDEILNNKEIVDSIKKIKTNCLPLHTKIIAFAVKTKSRLFLRLYATLMKIHLKN